MEKIYATCDVCGNKIEIDKYGNGKECSVCGWRQSEESFDHPDTAGIMNIPTLNNAKKQFQKGKSATLANFNDFIKAYENYGEVEFTYNQIRYGLFFDDENNKVVLLNIKDGEMQKFIDIQDFAKNAKIGNINLKDLWDNVTDTDFLQGVNE